jgi:flagellar hook-associated protein 2
MVMRISGLSTGFDTDGTVSKLMSAARIPLNKFIQKKQQLEWQRDDYRAMNNKVLEFRSNASNMKLESTYLAKKASVSNESAASVSVTSVANEGVYSLEVIQTAKTASVTSSALGAGSDTKKLSEIGMSANSTFTITGDKGSATLELKTTDTIAQFVANVNAESSVTGVKVSYDSTMDRLFFVSSATGTESKINLKMKSLDSTVSADPADPSYAANKTANDLLGKVFKISGATGVEGKATETVGSVGALTSTSLVDSTLTSTKKFTVKVDNGMGAITSYDYDVTSTTTYGQLMDKINSDLGKTEGISSYLDATGHLSFYNPTGTKTLTFADDSGGTLLTKTGYNGGQTTSAPLDYYEYQDIGENAKVKFNNVAAEYQNNNFTIAGMNFTAKTEGQTTNVTVNQDVDAVYNTIKSFVDKYNELVETVNKKMDEKKYRDFLPLTEEQKKEMKEDDIKRWEEKAKSGMLRNDPLLSQGLNEFRRGISEVVQGLPTGQVKGLAEIGISTSVISGGAISGNYLENGKIYIDDAKLKKAISEKPDEVMALFRSNDNNKDSDDGDGIAVRMYDKANALFTAITSKAGTTGMVDTKFTIGKDIKDIDKRADALSRRLESLETRYYKQFTAMESYINKMNSQSTWLSQQFSQ